VIPKPLQLVKAKELLDLPALLDVVMEQVCLTILGN
jgi:hypothetical protein